jgi:hypothetical protein
MKLRLLSRAFLCLSLFLTTTARAQWVNNGTPLANAAFTQSLPTVVPDGTGGAIVVWQDQRAGNNYDVYAQRVDEYGSPQWAANGISVITATGDQNQIVATSDGAGGAIVMWADLRAGNNDIYAQRISASGTLLWPVLGAAINTIGSSQQIPTSIMPDGANGAFVSFNDSRSGLYDVYMQRINASGVTQWAGGGVAVSATSGDQYASVLTSDGAGGAIVAWTDSRAGGSNLDVYAQRMSSGGVAQWTANGVAVCTAANSQDEPSIVADGVGGAIVAWEDARSVSDIYAQRLSSSGAALWTSNGQAVCTAANNQYTPVLVSDGNQGAIIAWYDNRSGIYNEYAQRMNSIGSPMWGIDGVPVCTASGNKDAPSIAADAAGGAFIAWQDTRSGGIDIYAQHMTSFGAAQWATDGVPVCTSGANQFSHAVAADGAGSIIVAWYDERNGTNYSDIYAQRIDGRYGYWGHPEAALDFVKDVPADQGGKVRMEWTASGRDAINQQTISHYTIWRAIDQLAFASALQSGASAVTLSDMGSKFSGKAIRKESGPLGDYYWELVGTQDAIYRSGYAFTAATSFDSTAASIATHHFQVVAHALGSQYINWPSNILAGHSVDNLAPPAPLFLTALRVSADVHLKWNGVHVADLKNYIVYRATSTGVTPIPVNFLANDTDTVLVDAGAPGSALYYIVTANDVHGNQGTKSNEASVAATTGVGNLPPITALTVLQNHPNPFTGETQLQVGLPVKEDVRVEIYDVAGRRVRDVTLPNEAKGWDTVKLEDRDDRGTALPSGVYFFRVHAGAESVTKKMVITR